MSDRMKVGLALGAGAMRGLAHIGILEVLEEHGIPIDAIAGSSMGSVVGGLYASGVTTVYMREMVMGITRAEQRRYMDVSKSKKGFISGQRVQTLIDEMAHHKNIEDLDLPYVAVTCCLEDAELIHIKEGNLAQAIRASISIPGVFEPVMINNKTYVDGGVMERVPVQILRDMGCDYIIGVDVGYRGDKRPTPHRTTDIIMAYLDIIEWQAMKHRMNESDIMLTPDVRRINPTTFEQGQQCMDLGRKEALTKVDDIRQQLAMLGIHTRSSKKNELLGHVPSGEPRLGIL